MCQLLDPQLVTKIEERIAKALPGADVIMDDSDGMHMALEVKAAEFKGLMLVDQHRMVYKALDDLLASGELHSIMIKTKAN